MSILQNLKTKAKILKRETYVVYLASKNKRTPWYAKALILFTIGYALSPIDLIPDFIPVLGYVDDLVLIPALLVVCLKLIPQDVMQQCRLQAQNQTFKLRNGYMAVIIIILIWTIFLYWLGKHLYYLIART
jgi:uncharacterized membrane protein YkvA (DUF1232 family)